MRNIISYSCIAVVAISCTNRVNVATTLKDTIKSEILQTNLGKDSDFKTLDTISNSIPDFLALSQNANEEVFGILQGVNNSDSAGPYIRRVYSKDSLSFILMFYPKSIQKKLVDFSSIKKKYKQNNYMDFICFAFVYPFPDPENVKDYHADNTPYPVFVKSYVRKNNSWQYISSQRVKNLSELSKYEINVMYSNLR